MNAIVTGSFDPITLGHLEIIKKAASCFEKIYIVALLNKDKQYMFTMEQKKEFIALSVADIPNAIADAYDGLTADYMHENNITKIIRGIRTINDESYEKKLAQMMKTYDESFDTIFVRSSNETRHISSSKVRELIEEGRNLDGYVHSSIKNKLIEAYKKNKRTPE